MNEQLPEEKPARKLYVVVMDSAGDQVRYQIPNLQESLHPHANPVVLTPMHSLLPTEVKNWLKRQSELIKTHLQVVEAKLEALVKELRFIEPIIETVPLTRPVADTPPGLKRRVHINEMAIRVGQPAEQRQVVRLDHAIDRFGGQASGHDGGGFNKDTVSKSEDPQAETDSERP